jgi:UDP-glucuronate 4-epimerase
MKSVLVTGAAGFIGFHLARRLLAEGMIVTGFDNLNDYYDVSLKEARLEQLKQEKRFSFVREHLENRQAVEKLFKDSAFDAVVHLAAQAGVRYSIENPHAYVSSNVTGFLNILEGCRHAGVKHLVFASTSSVYGANRELPFSVHQNVDHPLSLYAATKKSNELMAHVYASLYDLPVTGLRFFTVYGPWGRPDMAYFKFTKSIVEEMPIEVYNEGNMKRDFTYIDDIVDGIIRVLQKMPSGNPTWSGTKPDAATSFAPYRVYNIGNNEPVLLMDFIKILEEQLGKTAKIQMRPMQPGDVQETCADIEDIKSDVDFKPSTDIREGLVQFVKWYRNHYDQQPG